MKPSTPYIARDRDGMLYLYASKPRLCKKEGKFVPTWYDGKYRMSQIIDKKLCPHVTFENSPYKILDFIVEIEK